ncbi:hypothetical protein DL96DRAFT_1600690, partial [Flagelloscypha sp. PMI_526]
YHSLLFNTLTYIYKASTADAPSILKTPNYQITAVSTSSIESATKSAKVQADAQGGKVEVKAYHGDTSAIWNDPNVDLVGITLKKNFFVEWPVGASIEETKEILDMAKTAGVKGVVGLQGKFNPIFLKVSSPSIDSYSEIFVYTFRSAGEGTHRSW